MSIPPRGPFPLAPLLKAYVRAGAPSTAELHRLTGLGPRFEAVHAATARFLYSDFLDRASDADLAEALGRFYEACVQPPLHLGTIRARAGLLRHGLAALVRGRGSIAKRLEACVAPTGAYHVPGLGPSFWSAVAQALSPMRNPGWLSATVAGACRLGLYQPRPDDQPATVYAALLQAAAKVRAMEPHLSALHVDHFLALVGSMHGRHLFGHGEAPCAVAAALARVRQRRPLRELLKERGHLLAVAQERLEAALAVCDGKGIGEALAIADPVGAGRSPLDWRAWGEELTLWVGRLWEADDPWPVLTAFWKGEAIPGAGPWLPAAVLHLRDAQCWPAWDEEMRRGYATLDDAALPGMPMAQRYRLFTEGVAWLRQRHGAHPLEVPQVLAALAEEESNTGQGAPDDFLGFCSDTFEFLRELAVNNNRAWMEAQRDRYRFAVREPMAELCRALAARYVGPVLRDGHGWGLDTAARSGRALTSVVRNAYGRGGPYADALWIAFCQRDGNGPRDDVQFFVRLDGDGVRFGLRIGRKARAALARLRKNVASCGELVVRALIDRGAAGACTFSSEEGRESRFQLTCTADLIAWAGRKSLVAEKSVPAGASLLEQDELVGDVLLTFDRLAPLYACAVEDDAGRFLSRWAQPGEGCTEADFCRATYLGPDWLRRARELLALKKQLILQGVPGTGKTHVARWLARLLTAGQDDALRLVQFHPAYSYEELVEGIKVRSVAVEGRHDVTYPVEDGLLTSFAAEAARRPSEPFVLVIDEINRGNLPRIFGELLYLLEYREQAVELPCSRRRFRLPANLYLIGTMNAADRSVAAIDQALRRRFSFLEMSPDANTLASWLAAHVPAAGPAFAGTVVRLFERLNARLRAELGPHALVGHSYFMVRDLNEERLEMIWRHHVQPLLQELFAAHPDRWGAYSLEALLERRRARSMELVPLEATAE